MMDDNARYHIHALKLPVPPTDAQRWALWQWVGTTIRCEATLTDWHAMQQGTGTRTTLVRHVVLATGKVAADHLWVSLPPEVFASVQPEQRFRLQGRVWVYARKDGTRDVSLCDVKFLRRVGSGGG